MTLKSRFTRRSLLRGSFGAAMARSLPAPIPTAYYGGRVDWFTAQIGDFDDKGRIEYYRDTDSVFTNRPFPLKLLTNSLYGKFGQSPNFGVRIKVTKEAIDGYRRSR